MGDLVTSERIPSKHPTLFSRLANFFGVSLPGLRGFRTLPADAPPNPRAFDVNGQYALTSAAVWRCCSIIANSISTLPTHVFAETDEGKVKAFEHPLYRLLTLQPNEMMTVQQWLQPTLLHMLLWGNAFTYVVRNSRGEVLSLWPLLPGEVRVEANTSRGLDYYYPSDEQMPLDPGQIIHFRLFTMDGLLGLSVIQYQRGNLLFEHLAQNYAAGIYANGGQRPSGVLKYPTVLKKEQVEAIRASWNAIHSATGQVAILEQGASYEAISAPLSDLDYMAQNQFSIEQIARIFGVPLHLLDAAQKPTYASVEQDSIEFLRYTMSPWIVCLEKSIVTALLEPPYFYKFNIAGFERSDIKSRYESYATARNWGWLSVNDIRELEDMNRLDDRGDVYLQPLNMIPAGTVIPVKQTTATGG